MRRKLLTTEEKTEIWRKIHLESLESNKAIYDQDKDWLQKTLNEIDGLLFKLHQSEIAEISNPER